MTGFEKVKSYLLEIVCQIVHEDTEEELVVVENEEEGILNMIVDCEDPIVIVEQFLVNITFPNTDILTFLLQKNREIVHGAFVLDETGKKVLFRDTLQLENLDLNELEASVNSLSLLIAEFHEKLIEFSNV